MYDTTVTFKPRGEWRPGMTYEKLVSEMDSKLQFAGLTNTWTMPIENRLDMELTGIKTPVGLRHSGPFAATGDAVHILDSFLETPLLVVVTIARGRAVSQTLEETNAGYTRQ